VHFISAASGRQMRKDVQRMAGLTGPRGVVSTWIGVFHDTDTRMGQRNAGLRR